MRNLLESLESQLILVSNDEARYIEKPRYSPIPGDTFLMSLKSEYILNLKGFTASLHLAWESETSCREIIELTILFVDRTCKG